VRSNRLTLRTVHVHGT